MSAVTWGKAGNGKATVFCNHCRTVFASDVDTIEASRIARQFKDIHHCTTPNQWRVKQESPK